ncbi:MAG: glycosyltransferase [Ignavibacteriae bacterium]|nr:glycosyltransferase [Ignavibacteriota bacterium]
MRVLVVTSEWPTESEPQRARFVVRHIEALRALGVDIDVYSFRGGGNPLNYARIRKDVRSRIRNGGYDLVHAQWGQSALVTLPAPVPLVVTYRGSDLEGVVGRSGRYTTQGRVLRFVSMFVSRYADAIILVSNSLARHIPGRSFTLAPSGIDLAHFRPIAREEARTALRLPISDHLVLFAANPAEPIKQHWLAEKAMSRVRETFPHARLIIAHGVQYEQMPLYMNACDVLLLTSAHEGSPNVVKEALACDLPVVATDVGDVAFRVAGVDGCHVCPQKDAEALAAGLIDVLRRNARISGRAAVLDLDERLIAGRVLDVYTQVLQRTGKPPRPLVQASPSR